MWICINVYMYICINVHVYQCIHVYMATRPHILHDFPDGFSPDFLDLTIFRLISFNALFHDVFHEAADGETFLSGYALNLVNKFLLSYKVEMSPGFIIGRIALCLRVGSRNLLLLRIPRRPVKSVLRMNGSLSENVAQQDVHILLCHSLY